MSASRPFLRTAGADVSARKPYDVISQPRGADYRALLSSAMAQCDSGVLVFKTPIRGPKAAELMDRLQDHVIAETALAMGTMVRFRLDAAAVEILATTVGGLYGWRAPDLPEDLCLFRRDGSPWLVTVSAEGLGYVEVTPFEKLLLGRNAPGLPAALAHQGARDAILAVFERRLEAAIEGLTAGLTEYATALVDEGREGLVEALGQWLESGEPSRVAVALDVIGAIGLDELASEVGLLRHRADAGALAPPPVFRSSSVLGQRWSEMQRRRLDRVLDALGGGSGTV